MGSEAGSDLRQPGSRQRTWALEASLGLELGKGGGSCKDSLGWLDCSVWEVGKIGKGLQEPPGQGAPQCSAEPLQGRGLEMFVELDQLLTGKCVLSSLQGKGSQMSTKASLGRDWRTSGADKMGENPDGPFQKPFLPVQGREKGLLSLLSTPAMFFPWTSLAPPLPGPFSSGRPSLECGLHP